MSIDFPNSPSNGDTYVYSGETYRYNGVAWVRVRDRVTTFNGATGAIVGVTSVQGKTGDVTLTDLEITHGVETFNGLSGSIDTTSLTLPVAGLSGVGGITFSDGTFQPTAARSGFRYTLVSSGSGLGTPSSGNMDIDKAGEVDTLIINNTDKEGNDLEPLFQKLRDNGGYLEIMTGDFSQAAVVVIESQSGDDGTVTTGETTITVGSTISTVQAQFDIEQGLDSVSITDVYLRVVPNAANFIREFNGITGSVDTSSLNLHVAGLSADGTINALGIFGPSAITFSNGEVIRNNPDGSIQIIPSDEGGNHFGIEIDATEWGFGPVVNVIDESGTQVTKAIRLDTDVVMSNTNVPDGTPATIFFNNASDRGMAQNSNGDGTIGMGVNGSTGHFAVVSKFHLDSSNRSMSTADKTALGMNDPQFLVYSADANDANDYVRIEHDQTDANIYSGNGGINLVPLSGAVGISGGGLNVGTNGITFGDDTTQKGAAKDVATFTIQASSAITTDSKTNAMYRMPYNATLLGLQGKITANGNIRGSIDIAGPDFGDPTTGHASAISFQHTSGGNTFDHTSIDQASVDAGDYLYVDVSNNASGSTGAQFFVTYETR